MTTTGATAAPQNLAGDELADALAAAREARTAARDLAIDTLDYIRATRPDTDPAITTRLKKILFALREAAG